MKNLGKVFLAVLCASAALMISVFAIPELGNVEGNIVFSARADGVIPNIAKLCKLTVTNKEDNSEKVLYAETSFTNRKRVSFSEKLAKGLYDIKIEKQGYLDCTVTNVAVDYGSEIVLPDITLIPGNVNADSKIDLSDVVLSLRSFDTSDAYADLRVAADIDEDGFSTVSDFGQIKAANNFGKSTADTVLLYSADYDTAVIDAQPNAYYLIDDVSLTLGANGITSGWDKEDYFQILNKDNSRSPSLGDNSDTEYRSLSRRFQPVSEGRAVYEFCANVALNSEGIYIQAEDENRNALIKVITHDGFYYVCDESSADFGTKTEAPVTSEIELKMDMNLDDDICEITINGVFCGLFDMYDGGFPLQRLRHGTSAVGTGTITAYWNRLYTDYSVNEVFMTTPSSILPWDFEYNGDFYIDNKGGTGTYDSSSLYTYAFENEANYITKEFAPISGNTVFETFMLLPVTTSGAYVSLKSDDTEVFAIVSDGSAFKTRSGEAIRTYTANIWQTLRITADTASGKAKVSINGKPCGEFNFENAVDFFNNIEIGINSPTDAEMWIDDITVYNYTEPDDYVPTPVSAQTDDYYIGLNICSLWRNGNHYGWDCITPYPDVEPLMGYYDEGNPEVADWEIKMMVEHGIDYQHLCWYCPSDNITEPIKKTRMNDALHGGFFNAKYSDMMKFCIMWENNSGNVNNLAQFKNYIWNYWKEYYFSDPRHMTMDNMPVVTVWNLSRFISGFGGEAGAADAISFMREDIQTLGYDGLIILFANSPSATVARIGGDGSYQYHWGVSGNNPTYQINNLLSQQTTYATHIVPTISVGFNNIGWSGVRKGLVSVAGHKQVAEYVRDTFMPKYNTSTWKDKAIIISTWNEFGEGTYINPSGYCGYGFLDNVREVFANDQVSHNDLTPTAAQKARIGKLMPPDRSLIRPMQLQQATEVMPQEELYAWDMTNAAKRLEWSELFNIANFTRTASSISGSLTKADGGIILNSSISAATEDVVRINVRMKTSTTGSFDVMFTTTDDPLWNSQKKITTLITTAGEYVDYYVDVSSIAYWMGTVNALRIDPLNSVGDFEISKIAVLGYSDAQKTPKLVINGVEYENDYAPTYSGGELYMPANPKNGFFSLLNVYYEYSRFTGVLKLYHKDSSIVLTVGSATAVVNGTPTNTGLEFYQFDGLPAVPVKLLCDTFGFNYTDDTHTFEVKTISDAYIQAYTNRTPLEYEFNIPGDAEGWDSSSTGLYCDYNGCISGISNASDPISYSPFFTASADKYKKVALRMKYSNPTGTADMAQMFFITEANSSYSEVNSARAFLNASNNGGGFVEYILDFTDVSGWNGVITRLRLDPLAGQGTFSIDYIRFIADEDYGNTEPVGYTLRNGDAEGSTNYFISSNASISIIEDEGPNEISGNHVYLIEPINQTKQWVYFRQKMYFKNNTTYLVKYDAKVLHTADGTELTTTSGDALLNLRYYDANLKTDHVIGGPRGKSTDGWLHYEKTVAVTNSFDRSNDEFSIYANPVNEMGIAYMLDNVSITEVTN